MRDYILLILMCAAFFAALGYESRVTVQTAQTTGVWK